MKNIIDLLKCADAYIDYLKEKEVSFDSNGFPILSKDMFLDEAPDLIVPFYNRNNKCVKNKNRTVLCTFAADKDIYPRFKKIFDEIEIYKNYMGVVTSDLTVTMDMDIEWQKFMMLLNQLYGAILAVNGIKILLNIRTGNNDTINLFENYPKNIICVSGFLGCKNNNNEYDYTYISKIYSFLPSQLLIYGKEDKKTNQMLDKNGINYKYYTDLHRLGGK